MKRITSPFSLLLSSLLLSSFLSFSQSPREVTATELAKFKSQVEQEAAQLKTRLQKKYSSDPLTIEFALDTFRIEALARKITDIDYSTVSVVNENNRSAQAYDQLLNKYYKRLLGKLSKADQEVLKQAQRTWVAYRDAERKLIDTMSKEEYSGGGTMQQPINAGEVLVLTENRVFQLVGHLSRIEE